jgi:hypothetical protein
LKKPERFSPQRFQAQAGRRPVGFSFCFLAVCGERLGGGPLVVGLPRTTRSDRPPIRFHLLHLAFTKHPPAANHATGQPTGPDSVVDVLAFHGNPSGTQFLNEFMP